MAQVWSQSLTGKVLIHIILYSMYCTGSPIPIQPYSVQHEECSDDTEYEDCFAMPFNISKFG